MSQAARKREEQAEAVTRLREILKPGDTVYTVLRHVSSSGMSRDIDLYVFRDDKPFWLTGYAATATGQRRAPKGSGIRIGGCGMDMGFALVYGLSRTVFADGFHCTGVSGYDGGRCPSNDHTNERGKSDYRTDRVHSDPGYALRQEWL
jgi:hypothetical protein